MGSVPAPPFRPRRGLLDRPGWSAVVGGVAAGQAHLQADWSVDEIDQRTTASGASISFQIHHAQAPPDSLETGGGTVAARQGDEEVACGPGSTGTGYVCRSAP